MQRKSNPYSKEKVKQAEAADKMATENLSKYETNVKEAAQKTTESFKTYSSDVTQITSHMMVLNQKIEAEKKPAMPALPSDLRPGGHRKG